MGETGKPKHASPESIVGRLSSDLIAVVYAPKFRDIAQDILETYAGHVVEYEETILNGTEEAEIEASGKISGDFPVQPPLEPLFSTQFLVDEFTNKLSETSEYFGRDGGWKIEANSAKFERLLDERYGMLRPLVTKYPQIEQVVRSVQRKYLAGDFSPFRQSDPPIPRSTAIILLFMMQRGGISWQILLLVSLFFLVGLQPWALIAIIAIIQAMVNQRKNKPIGKMRKRIPLTEPYYRGFDEELRQDCLLKPVGRSLGKEEKIDPGEYDVLILGHGPGALYTAALLCRAGKRVVVVSSESDASGCLTLRNLSTREQLEKFASIPFDVDCTNVSKISGQQKLLVPALASTTDIQGGVRFAKVGSEEDSFTFEILSIPGVGSDSRVGQVPIALSAGRGLYGLMDDAATMLGDGWPVSEDDIGHSTTGAYVRACESINSSASLYYLSKILPDAVNGFRSASAYQESAIRFTQGFLNNAFPLNSQARSFMAGLGMKGENLKPNKTSLAAHVTNVSASTSPEGMHYPIGGPRALCHALGAVIEQNGGRIFNDVDVVELLFDEARIQNQNHSSKSTETVCPPCVGIKMKDGREVRFERPSKGQNEPVIISSEGVLHTFINLLPDDIRTRYGVPKGLPALTERRPVFKILFLLNGDAEELSLTGADYYRLPAACKAFDEMDPVTGQVRYGEIGGSGDDSDAGRQEPSADLEAEQTDIGKREASKSNRLKFEPGWSWMHISFPSAKDPSFRERHGHYTTCVVTIEADDDFVTVWDTKPKLVRPHKSSTSQGDLERLYGRVKKEMIDIYPQLEDKIEFGEVRGPFQKGLSHTPERFAAKGVRVDTPYPNLYLSGSDITVGDSFSASMVSGWLAANAVIGYSYIDLLFLEKNITADITQFLEGSPGDGDIAVPYKDE